LCHWSFIIWSFVLAAILLVSGCSKHSAPAPDVLAKVGSAEIRLADFNHEVERRAKANQPVVSAEALLDEMIGRELLLLKASQAGLSNDPEVRRAVQAVLINKFKERDMKPKLDNVEVTADEVRARYEGNLQQYTTPAKARLAMLYLQTDSKMSPEKRAELKVRLEQARQTAGSQLSPASNPLPVMARASASQSVTPAPASRTAFFGNLAISSSDDQASRYKGGDIGWFDQGREGYRWPTEVISAGMALATGEVSGVIETSKGYFVVAKTDSREPVVTPLEKVDATFRRQITVAKRQEAEQQYMKQLRSSVPVQIYTTALTSVTLPTVTAAKTEAPQPPAFP